ncbi:hypothetical protein BC936DRAFT_137847 [Jimgerdemannia flammicorona]|uniref:Peptidase M48 domain-containing protein n=1 Tax=Jimgerdemannia flammicorona TaxID=994334 RepID=A0A433CWI4_9FUNG|nr:hypothetical protein BC936DRAFT_137847 [Jimgerdemannia flammicorona]
MSVLFVTRKAILRPALRWAPPRLLHHLPKPPRPPTRWPPSYTPLGFLKQYEPSVPPTLRSFHTTPPTKSPIIPLPYFLALLKSGKVFSIISFSSKGALTFLPHSILKNYSRRTKFLISIPITGVLLLIVIGLDCAPNTGRWRLIYLSEDEERDKVTSEVSQLLTSQFGLVVPKDHELTRWAQRIIDNLSVAAQDDIRSPAREYTPEDYDTARPYELNILCDASTLNAVCYGQTILLYDLMIQFMDYDEPMIAAILAHEISHSIQRHFVEQHGFASLLFMLADIGRGILWSVTEVLGPYVNEKFNDMISAYITLETQNTYNRKLEKEADLVGLMIMAKAGYDPEAAVRVWERMAMLEEEVGKDASRAGVVALGEVEERHPAYVSKSPNHTHHYVATRALATAAAVSDSQRISRSYTDPEPADDTDSNLTAASLVESLLTVWFGGTHPPNVERVSYMREHLDEARQVYRESLRLNGTPRSYLIDLQKVEQQEETRTGVGRERGSRRQGEEQTWLGWALGWWSREVPGVEVGARA